jgi:predicted MFS family arabinose efflux permease
MNSAYRDGAAPEQDFARLLMVMTLTAFVCGGGIHYQTPMLEAIAADLDATRSQMGWIPTLSFGGMFVGMLLLVPLGDRVDRRPLILAKLGVLCLAQAGMAFAPSIHWLALGSFVTGVSSCLVQGMMAIVAGGAKPSERGRAVGTLFTGLFVGILFARIMGGVMASHFGWRSSYVLSSAMLAVMFAVLSARLPHSQPSVAGSYGALLRSVFDLLRSNVHIRRAASIQFMLGVCYGGFWAVIAPMMTLHHGLTPAQIGLIGIPGAAGILVARPAGRWMDRSGILPVAGTAIAAMVTAWIILGFGVWTIVAVVIGVILLDCALRAALVSNQTLVGTAAPTARARANTVFGTHAWAGNATGALLANQAFIQVGWFAVCATALLACSIALVIHLRARQDARRPPTD